jgi:hypothetical protein
MNTYYENVPVTLQRAARRLRLLRNEEEIYKVRFARGIASDEWSQFYKAKRSKVLQWALKDSISYSMLTEPELVEALGGQF